MRTGVLLPHLPLPSLLCPNYSFSFTSLSSSPFSVPLPPPLITLYRSCFSDSPSVFNNNFSEKCGSSRLLSSDNPCQSSDTMLVQGGGALDKAPRPLIQLVKDVGSPVPGATAGDTGKLDGNSNLLLLDQQFVDRYGGGRKSQTRVNTKFIEKWE